MTVRQRRGRHHAGYNLASLLRKRQPRRATVPAREAPADLDAVSVYRAGQLLTAYIAPF